MEKISKINERHMKEDNLGFILWQLESIEKFFPCYQSMMKKEE